MDNFRQNNSIDIQVKNSFSNIKKQLKEEKSIYVEINIKLEYLIRQLDETREKIRSNKLKNFSFETLEKIEEKFKNQRNEYDSIKNEETTPEENFNETEDRLRLNYLDKCIRAQTLISRIAHKLNQRKNELLIKKYEEKLKNLENITEDYKKVKDDIPEIKGSILTISSLILTIFSIIQINFIAFEKSSDYTILDRLILFSGINVFLLMAITTIFFIIKSIIEKKNKYYGFVGLFILIFISLFCYLSFNYDSFTRKINNKNINNISQENITNIENKIKTIDEILQKNINNLKQDTQMDIKNLKQDIQYIKEDIQYIKKDIKEINYEKREE